MTSESPLLKVELGAGATKRPGYLSVDWNPLTKPDISHNLNSLPWPFQENSIEHLIMQHVLEHLDRPFTIMREAHRILAPGGLLSIRVPHFSRGFTHAEHEHGFDISFPKYFDPEFTASGYVGVPFKLEKMQLRWLAFSHLLRYYGISPTMSAALRAASSAISFLANLNPLFCSRIWCFWVGGFEEIEFEFRCVK